MMPYSSPDFFPDGPPGAPFLRMPGPPLAGDEDLALRVADRLRTCLAVTGNRIVVEVQNRVVILEGLVATAEDRALAHRLVWLTAGVADVCNVLSTWDQLRQQSTRRS